MTETQAGSAATLVYDGSGMPAVKEFTTSGLVEDALYAFKVKVYESIQTNPAMSIFPSTLDMHDNTVTPYER